MQVPKAWFMSQSCSNPMKIRVENFSQGRLSTLSACHHESQANFDFPGEVVAK